MKPESVFALINNFYKKENSNLQKINIIEPLPQTLLPCDISSIAFSWEDSGQSTSWLLTISNKEKTLVNALLDKPWWIPKKNLWDKLKKTAKEKKLTIKIKGIGGWNGREILSENKTFSFSFSKDALDARIMFMRKPIPFLKAKQNPEMTKLLVGNISSYKQPEIIMSNLTTCANCHTYSSDGKVFAMDVDYSGDKGAFAMTPMRSVIKLGKNNIFSWNKIPVRKPASYSMGLFAQLSPSGRYLAATVNETSVFVMMDDLYFSQLFFPSTGQIAIFDHATKNLKLLPGASLETMVQTAPAWSSDGKIIAFSAIPTNPDLIQKVLAKKIVNESPKQNIKDLNKKYNVQFDIYTVSFNNGKGGKAQPLAGAANNGYSNYFPRYSPDGRWIVFTQSKTGLVLQPESRLCIIPAQGGTLRYLKSNMPIMNSWHSWSPNSKWIIFTCKATSPYTQLYITHIDNNGESSPAVRLFRFSNKELAAMVPEFIPFSAKIPRLISLQPDSAEKKNMANDGR
ncbi:MAG: hypothetical protein K8S18_13345 [Desulfobacula sp.]|nr:hypothetical protein [Desulfobacula sp.]